MKTLKANLRQVLYKIDKYKALIILRDKMSIIEKVLLLIVKHFVQDILKEKLKYKER